MSDLTPMSIKISPGAPESFVYVKQHEVREVDEKKPKDRTLFMLNVPPCASENSLKKLFATFGNVEDVALQLKPMAGSTYDNRPCNFLDRPRPSVGFKVCYVVFDKPSSLQKALVSKNKPLLLFSGEQEIPVLTRLFCQKRREQIPDHEDLKKKIEDFMGEYDGKVELEKQKAKQMVGVPDEEGWVTVIKHKKNSVIPQTDAVSQKIIMKDKKRRAEKALLNFYSFQMKESKMEQLAKLRKNFKDDKERIAAMKASRKFKPY